MKLQLIVFLISLNVFSQAYQVGEKWSKKHIAKAPKRINILKESVGEIGSSATLFYIGKYQNKHMAITNYHVCPNSTTPPHNKCINKKFSFFYFKDKRGRSLEGKVKRIALTNKNLDLAVLELSFQKVDNFERFPNPLEFSKDSPYLNQKLVSIGYGVNNNEYGVLMAEYESTECQVYSRELRLLTDPDTLNPIKYKVKSFLHGCDVSHGDSGSPILDRDTLGVVGLLWTGKYPKDRAIAREDFYTLPIEYLWGQLNYASPGYLIYEEISKL